MLEKVKLTLRISSSAFDEEIRDLIAAAKADLGLAGITNAEAADNPRIVLAIKTYCKLHFGEPEDPARIKLAYDEMKAQMSMATGFTDWGEA